MSDKFPVPFTEIGEFELVEMLQESQAAFSFRALQRSLGQSVFLKILKPHIQNQKEWVTRFHREARVCAKLKHPNIVQVYTLGEAHGYHFMAMEYVEGESLKKRLDRDKILSLQEALRITHQILQALEYAHEHQIIHRDIKPGNILISSKGWVKLTDFGLAHIGEDAELTQQGALLGTPAYMAPEQVLGERITAAADIFSLGATLYEMLSGIKPFAADSYSACIHKILNVNPEPLTNIISGLPAEVGGAVQRALEKEPGARFASCKDFQTALPTPGEEVPSGINAQDDPPICNEGERENPDFSIAEKNKRIVIWFSGIGLILLVLAFVLFRQTDYSSEIKLNPPPTQPFESVLDSAALKENKTRIEKNREPYASRATDFTNKPPETFPQNGEEKKEVPAKTYGSKQSDGREINTPSIPSTENPLTTEADSVLVQLEIIPWAKFLVDGLAMDSAVSRKNYLLAAGEHEFTFIHPNFKPRVIKKNLQGNKPKVRISFSFLQSAGYLWVDVRPWAEIYINKNRLDTTPLKKPLALEPGKYLLELRHPEFPAIREIITVKQGDTLKILKTLTN